MSLRTRIRRVTISVTSLMLKCKPLQKEIVSILHPPIGPRQMALLLAHLISILTRHKVECITPTNSILQYQNFFFFDLINTHFTYFDSLVVIQSFHQVGCITPTSSILPYRNFLKLIDIHFLTNTSSLVVIQRSILPYQFF